ncbi:glycosyltransferase [Globomyces pollinis-pini]|nr:glycosyltransferase [Globomyces pollinis-pini]
MELFFPIISLIVILLIAGLYQKYLSKSYENQLKSLGLPSTLDAISFFHPFCDDFGGGERVLWVSIQCIQQSFPQKSCIIYIWNGAKLDSILNSVESKFGVNIDPARIHFIKLSTWRYLQAKRYPRFTLILSSFGSMIPGLEAMILLKPKIFIESVGYAFINPIAKLFGSKVISYVHYPTISSDMIKVIENRTSAFNNSNTVAKSSVLSKLKVHYYKLFSFIYGKVGSYGDVVLVNSKWTQGHINDIWKIPSKTSILYPPCDTDKLLSFPIENRKRIILSVAQFRPEKNHHLQIDIIAKLYQDYPSYFKGINKVSMVMIGGVRNQDDRDRVAKLRTHIKSVNLDDIVKIVENASYDTLLYYLETSLIGFHTMSNEHFGISIIEYMAAGMIAIAHESGGPLMDIITSPGKTGYLCNDLDSYVNTLHTVLGLTNEQHWKIQNSGRKYVQDKFSTNAFTSSLTNTLKQYIYIL